MDPMHFTGVTPKFNTMDDRHIFAIRSDCVEQERLVSSLSCVWSTTSIRMRNFVMFAVDIVLHPFADALAFAISRSSSASHNTRHFMQKCFDAPC
jgi:hypothetical protein